MSCEGQQELHAYVTHLDKNSGHHGSGGLSWLAVFHTCCHTSLLKELRAIHAIPLGQDKWKLTSNLFWTLSPASFAFADFKVSFQGTKP